MGFLSNSNKHLIVLEFIGNFAVHPGQLDLRDDVDTANKLFVFINVIVENQISQPKLIDQF